MVERVAPILYFLPTEDKNILGYAKTRQGPPQSGRLGAPVSPIPKRHRFHYYKIVIGIFFFVATSTGTEQDD